MPLLEVWKKSNVEYEVECRIMKILKLRCVPRLAYSVYFETKTNDFTGIYYGSFLWSKQYGIGFILLVWKSIQSVSLNYNSKLFPFFESSKKSQFAYRIIYFKLSKITHYVLWT